MSFNKIDPGALIRLIGAGEANSKLDIEEFQALAFLGQVEKSINLISRSTGKFQESEEGSRNSKTESNHSQVVFLVSTESRDPFQVAICTGRIDDCYQYVSSESLASKR